MTKSDWFEVISDVEELEQGDLINGVRYVLPDHVSDWPTRTTDALPMLEITSTIIVLTQSCDLVIGNSGADQRKPSDLVTICPVQSLKAWSHRQNTLNSSAYKETIRLNENRTYFMLPERNEPILGHELSLVHLRSHVLLPRKYLQTLALSQGTRLRLKSPMRESLSSAFGLLFSRVAIDEQFEIDSFYRKPTSEQKLLNAMQEASRDERTRAMLRFKLDGPHARREDTSWQKSSSDNDEAKGPKS